jgi:DNA-binding NarL/FixJ family response regulator
MRSTEPLRTFLSKPRGDLGRLPPRLPVQRSTTRATLTLRQREVAALLVGTGLSYKEIAARLDLSEGTVRTHTEAIYRALGVHSRPELTVALQGSGRDPAEMPERPVRRSC